MAQHKSHLYDEPSLASAELHSSRAKTREPKSGRMLEGRTIFAGRKLHSWVGYAFRPPLSFYFGIGKS